MNLVHELLEKIWIEEEKAESHATKIRIHPEYYSELVFHSESSKYFNLSTTGEEFFLDVPISRDHTVDKWEIEIAK